MPLVSPSHAWRVANLGAFAFTPDPRPGNPEAIRITGDWPRQYLVQVSVPQCANFGIRHDITVHYKVSKPLVALWNAWELAGLLPLVHTWDGCWVPRYKRQTGTPEQREAKCRAGLPVTELSNHSWASAFDVNARELPLGLDIPADHPFRQLVPIANEHGFFWGGDYAGRKDPMHFELAAV
jgi:hypothetical protein